MTDDIPGILACCAAALMLALATKYAGPVTQAMGWM